MVKLDRLPRTTTRRKKRLGRGYGSGRGGHTVGRGAKGLKARGKVSLIFTGTKTKKSFLKRLPLRRGKGKFKSLKSKPLVVNLKYLNLFKKGERINLKTLIEKRVVAADEAEKYGVKILGEGDLKVALIVELPTSKGAAEKVKKAGGKVVEVKNQPRADQPLVGVKFVVKKKEKPSKTKKPAKSRPISGGKVKKNSTKKRGKK